MKRKFSFNMPPIKMSAREAAEGPQPSPAHSASSSRSHNREESKDSICDSSPYISRPILDLQTEAELRAACRLILQNFKPSDHGMENTDPKLDFNMNRRREQKPSVDVKVSVRVPTGAPVLIEGTQSHSNPFLGRKSSTKTRTRAKADMEIRARTQNEGPARANSSRKRADFGWLDDRDDKREQNLRKYGRSSMDQARPANGKADDEEIVTPVTVASSYAYSKNASTAPTSASVTSGRSSNRRSRQIEGEDKNDSSQPQGRPTTAVRPPSRTASLRNGLRRTLSRSASKDSLRKTDTNDSQDAESQGSGWKGWGPIRRSLSRGSSRPGTSKGQAQDAEKKSEKVVNLNRDLPPLPGLDTWKEPEQPKKEEEKAKSPTSPVHIASLMKPQEPPQQDRVTAVRNPAHRRSGSDTLAVQYTQAFPVRTTSKLPLQIPPHPSRAAPNAPVNPDSPVAVSTGWSSTSNLNRGEVGSSTHTRQRSGDTQPTSSDAKMSMDVPNFSRTFSMDAPAGSYSTEVKIGKKEKDEQKSRLRKVFSGWMTRKQRKDQWMREIEKEGSIKDGVLVQDQSAGAPVVRY